MLLSKRFFLSSLLVPSLLLSTLLASSSLLTAGHGLFADGLRLPLAAGLGMLAAELRLLVAGLLMAWLRLHAAGLLLLTVGLWLLATGLQLLMAGLRLLSVGLRLLAVGLGCSWRGCSCTWQHICSHPAAEWSGQNSLVASPAGQGRDVRWGNGGEETLPLISSSPAFTSCPSPPFSRFLASFFSSHCTLVPR